MEEVTKMFGSVKEKALLMAVSAIGIFRIPLELRGYRLEKGFILIFEDDAAAAKAQEIFLQIWHARKATTKQEREELCNFEIGLRRYGRYDSAKEIETFLQEKSFLPVVLVGGVLPEELVETGYAFYIERMLEDIRDVTEEFKKLDQLTDNVNVLNYIIQNAEKSVLMDKYERNDRYAWCMKAFVVTAELWGSILQEELSEMEVRDLKDEYCETLFDRLDQMEDLYDVTDVEEVVKYFIMRYLDRHPKIKFINVTEATCEENNSVLYDDDTIYFSEEMLKEACEPVKESISFLQLKKEMEASGMIICNATKKHNYTVKKSILDRKNGKSIRIRYVKIVREKLRLQDGIDLIDYKKMEEETIESRII